MIQAWLDPRLRTSVVPMAEMAVSRDPQDMLVTYSLGSCIALALFHPQSGVAGLIHCRLPVSKLDPEQARRKPEMYVDTGVPLLLRAVYDLGAGRKGLVAKVVGAACLVDHKRLFDIGKRNYSVLRKMLWKNDILIAAEAVGGAVSRTVMLKVATGQVTIKSGGLASAL